jgi:RHS repeat-associated protein
MGPGPFQKPPKNKGEIITGSSNVFYEGKEAAMLGDTAEMCSDPSNTPVGKVMGTALQVEIGGGGGGSDEAREKASADAMKAAAAACHKWIDANFPPGSDREQAHRDVCSATGHPIDVATGKMFTRNVDFKLPGRIPFEFVRNYSSARSDRGPFGHSWRHSFERELVVHREFIAHRDANGRFLEFLPLEVGSTSRNELSRAVLERHADGYTVLFPDGTREFYASTKEPRKTALTLRLESIADRFDNRIRFTYSSDRLEKITDTAGRVVKLDYNGRGLISALRFNRYSPSHASTAIRTYRYSDDDDLVEWRDELGYTYQFEYHEHLVVRETDRNGFSFYFTYDGEGWCRETWGDGGIFYRRMEYDREKCRTRVIDSLGHVTCHAWNQLGVVETETNHHGDSWRFEYNDSLQPIRVEDPNENAWTSEYDDEGRLTKIENPEGISTSTEWDPTNLGMTYTDVYGKEWRQETEPNRRERRSIDPIGRVETERFNDHGDRVHVEHFDGRVTELSYNAQGDLERLRLPFGTRIERRYSHTGDLLSESDQLGLRLEVEYDARSDPVRVWDRARGEMRFEYDPERRVKRAVDPKGRSTVYEYSRFDRIVRIVEPSVVLEDGAVLNCSKSFEYDLENRVVGMTTSGGQETRFHYEGRPRPSRIEHPDGRVQVYERDRRGFIKRLYENDELVFEQSLDSEGRVLRRTTGDGEVLSYEYDAAGNVISGERDGRGLVTIGFDELGRRLFEAGENGRQEISYADGLSHLKCRWNDDIALDCYWTPSEFGGRWEARRAGESAIQLDYDVRSRVTCAQFGNGERHEMTYESWNTPASRTLIDPSGQVATENFELDEEGWLKRRKSEGSRGERYERDGKNRLVRLSDEDVEDPRDLAWGFDSNGNRVFSTTPDGMPYRSEFRAGNQVCRVDDEQISYDHRGRVASIRTAEGVKTAFSWDSSGQLKQVGLPGGETVEMRYDAFGRRIEKTSSKGTTRFGWVGSRLAHEVRPDGEERHYLYHDVSHRLLACYIRKPEEDWRLYSVVTDLRGAPTRLTRDDQEVVWEGTLGPFGEYVGEAGGFDQPLALPGQYRDAETGLHYNFSRYYLPKAACYLTPDPIGLAGGENGYAYVTDPICWADPLGLSGDDYTSGYHGASGDKILAMLDSGTIPPRSGEIFLGGSPGETFLHGGDTSRGATFSVEVVVDTKGVETTRTSTPGTPRTTIVHSDDPRPVTINKMHVRRPNPDGDGFDYEVIEGEQNIRDYLAR